MNSQLPPIDPGIRDHLTRRAAGRPPQDLLPGIATALDAAPAPQARLRWPHVTWRTPQLAGAAIGVALVAIIAVAVLLPASHTGPAGAIAGYPANRALTTAELASLMAGPPLQTNTTLVASVTIEKREDVCPMNRYPTIGVVEGMASQVCVMGANVAAYLNDPKTSGTFAFRYLAPGYLGLIGTISPGPTGLTFRVADEWPVAGKTFLVEGWLGATGVPSNIAVSCAVGPTAGDVLDPSAADCPWTNWLSDDRTAPLIHSTVVGGTLSSDEAMSPHGSARYVEAGGMRLIDSIDQAKPVHGVYVVRSSTEQCPGDPPTSSRGCSYWRVLAEVADVSTPEPSASTSAPATIAPPETPIASPTASSGMTSTGLIGSGDRPLTQGELATLWASDPKHLAGRTAIVKGPVPRGFVCSDVGAADASASSPTCHVAILDGTIASGGYWAAKMGTDGHLSLVGELTVPADGSYAYSVEGLLSGTCPKAGDLALVRAVIGLEGGLYCDLPQEGPCIAPTRLGSTTPGSSASIRVATGTYEALTGNSKTHPLASGVFLIRYRPGQDGVFGLPTQAEVQAGFELVTL